MSISIKYLQEYIKSNDYRPELKERYFMKLAEEVGELSRAMRKNLRPESENEIKETIDEELWDVIYYAVAIANCYDIDLEKVIPLKEQLNNKKYSDRTKFEARQAHESV
jgi:NTP pyrophosphatase (non-canonical NTP hydrolase)